MALYSPLGCGESGALTQALGRLFALAEAYPEIRATANIGQLHVITSYSIHYTKLYEWDNARLRTLEPDGQATGCNPVEVGSTPTGVSDCPTAA